MHGTGPSSVRTCYTFYLELPGKYDYFKAKGVGLLGTSLLFDAAGMHSWLTKLAKNL